MPARCSASSAASASLTIAASPSASPSSISSRLSRSPFSSVRTFLTAKSRSPRSFITCWAFSGSFQSAPDSACAFSESRRDSAVSQSKMPPQEDERLLDVIGNGLDFGAHGSLHRSAPCSEAGPAVQPAPIAPVGRRARLSRRPRPGRGSWCCCSPRRTARCGSRSTALKPSPIRRRPGSPGAAETNRPPGFSSF